MTKCPYCAEEIQDDAIKCKHCGEWLVKQPDLDEESVAAEKVPAGGHSRRRVPFDAFLASLVVPGLGQIYNGMPKLGVILLITPILSIIIFCLSGLLARFSGLVAWCAIVLTTHVSGAVHAFISARRISDYKLKWFNRGLVYLAVLIVYLGMWPTILKSDHVHWLVGFKGYKVAADSSSRPTLIGGDHLVARIMKPGTLPVMKGDMILFNWDRYKGLNITDNCQVARWHAPDEIPPGVAFLLNSLISRVVAMGGESVEIRNDSIFVNGHRLEEPWARGYAKQKYLEGCGPYRIPEDSVLVAGDNKETFSMGLVNKKQVFGKVLCVYYSSLGGQIRWDRMGREIK